MKNTLFIVLLWLVLDAVNAQQSSLIGSVAVFNSQFETGKRQYVVNAQVEEDFGKSQPTFTEIDGVFRLPLIGIEAQEKIAFTVKKATYEVVNTDALQAVAGQSDTQRVYMAPLGKIAENKLKYYKINLEASEKALNAQLQRLEQEIFSITNDQKKLLELQAYFRQLQTHLEPLEASARAFAERYARTNLDDSSVDFQRAFRYFQQSQLDSALLILNNTLTDSSNFKILADLSRQTDLKEEYKDRLGMLQQSKKDIIETLHFKGNLHFINFEIPSTEQCFALLLRLDSTNAPILFDYGFILSKTQKTDKAIRILSGLHPEQVTPEQFINLNLELVKLYLQKKDFYWCNHHWQITSSFNKKAYKTNFLTYRFNQARLMTALGDIYFKGNDVKAAIQSYISSSTQFDKLCKDYKDGRYVYEQIQTNEKLGVALQVRQEMARAETAYLLAIMAYDSWPKKVQEKIKPEIAKTYFNLGKIYYDTGKYYAAASLLSKSLGRYEYLVSLSPQMYETNLAKTQVQLALAFIAVSDFDNALPLLSNAVTIFRKFASLDPASFGTAYAECLLNLGNLYFKQHQQDAARAAFDEGMKTLAIISGKNFHGDSLIRIAIIFGYAQIALFNGDFARSDSLLTLVLRERWRWHKYQSKVHVAAIAAAMNTRCALMRLSKDLPAAEEAVVQALQLWRKQRVEQQYIDRQVLIETLQTAKVLYLEWAQQGDLMAKQKLKKLYCMFPTFQKRIEKGELFALMTNSLQRSGSLHIHHDHKTQAEYWMVLNTAHAYLLQGKTDKAMRVYCLLKKAKDDQGNKYVDICIKDLDEFIAIGIKPAKLRSIRQHLQQN